MPWFVKQETFLRPHAEMQSHLQAHRVWVERLRRDGAVLSSGYLVDRAGQPGGGGLLLLQASSYAEAEALVLQDPMVSSGDVAWRLQEWRPSVGDLGVG